MKKVISEKTISFKLDGCRQFLHFSRACANSVIAASSGTVGLWMDKQLTSPGCARPSHPASPTSSPIFHTLVSGMSDARLRWPLPQTWPCYPTSSVLSALLPRMLMLPVFAGQLSPFKAQPGHDLIQEAHFRTSDLTGYTFLIFYLPRRVPPCPGTFQSASTLTKHLAFSRAPQGRDSV